MLLPSIYPQTLSVAFALLAGVTLSLPVSNNEEAAAATTTATAPQESSSSAEVPQGTIFNYEVPTEEELNPADLDDEERQLTELQPPAIDSYVPFRVDEPVEKPRKGGKKYNKEEKWINKNAAAGPKESSAEDNEERQYALLDFIIENLFLGIADQYNSQRRGLNADDGQVLVLNKGEYIPSPQRRIDESAEDEPIVFEMHGQQQQGGKGFKFGFDSGKSLKLFPLH